METNINNPEFIGFCKHASSIEVVEKVTNGNVRGLDKIALSNFSRRGQLPTTVENMLLAYFFNEFANKVYDRNSLSRMHDYWVTRKVTTVSQAEEMMKKDIHVVMEEIDATNHNSF